MHVNLCEAWDQELHVILIQMIFKLVLMFIIFNGALQVNELGTIMSLNPILIGSSGV
jgi:hypothetical protein